MCDFCNVKPGEEQLGYTIGPSMCWSKVQRMKNGILKLIFGYGEDPNDTIWHRIDYCPYCGEKQTLKGVTNDE